MHLHCAIEHDSSRKQWSCTNIYNCECTDVSWMLFHAWWMPPKPRGSIGLSQLLRVVRKIMVWTALLHCKLHFFVVKHLIFHSGSGAPRLWSSEAVQSDSASSFGRFLHLGGPRDFLLGGRSLVVTWVWNRPKVFHEFLEFVWWFLSLNLDIINGWRW